MSTVQMVSLLLGSSWSAGINLYLTIAGLGIAHRLHWLQLPGELSILSHPIIIGLAALLYAIEFFADKFPYVDSVWDSIHTFIRPVGGLVIAYMAMSGAEPVIQMATALVCGTIALDSHLTKATTRVAINTSPEPVTNSVASVTEDVSVLGAMYLIINHPVVLSILVIIFIIFSFWFLTKMWKFLSQIFSHRSSKSKNLSSEKNIS